MIRSGAVSAGLFLFFILLAACRSPEDPDLKGGILTTFDVQGERYSIFITDNEAIKDIYALRSGQSQARLPNGRLVRGRVSYNQPWSWHIDPEDIEMTEASIEILDGLPSHVEGNLEYWLTVVKRFCPWSARLVEVKDYR